MYSCNDTLAGGLPHSDTHGSTPARGSPWLFAACHVLHRLLVPRHPPNALLILDICDAAPKSRVHHAQKPSSGAVVRVQSSVVRNNRDGNNRLFEDSPGNIYSAHNRILSNRPFAGRLRDHRGENSTKSFTTPLNPRRRPLGRCSHKQQFPVRQFGRTTHQFSGVGCQDQNRVDRLNPCTNTLLMTRPETHQNLIHIPKNNTTTPSIKPGATAQTAWDEPGRYAQTTPTPNSGHSAILGTGISLQFQNEPCGN
jgi:hypothetical protein